VAICKQNTNVSSAAGRAEPGGQLTCIIHVCDTTGATADLDGVCARRRTARQVGAKEMVSGLKQSLCQLFAITIREGARHARRHARSEQEWTASHYEDLDVGTTATASPAIREPGPRCNPGKIGPLNSHCRKNQCGASPSSTRCASVSSKSPRATRSDESRASHVTGGARDAPDIQTFPGNLQTLSTPPVRELDWLSRVGASNHSWEMRGDCCRPDAHLLPLACVLRR
jgi:hypothetical protein